MTKQKDNILLPKVRGVYKINEPLGRYTWLNVGGAADVLFVPEDEADLCSFLQQKNPESQIFILGGGSNLLVRDGGIDGVVIKLTNPNFAKWRIENDVLYCGAGRLNFSLKNIIAENGLGGLEFLCSIPGTIGGAICGNAGCFGADMGQVVHSARVMNGQGEILNLQNSDFNFSYRHSDLKQDWIVLEVGLKFEKTDATAVSQKIAQNAEYRCLHQPQGIKTAGSTFKNPEGKAAWKLIKDSGADKLVCGGAKLSAQHCNFLQNEGGSAADIENLCCAVQKKVHDTFGIDLELEVKIIGREI